MFSVAVTLNTTYHTVLAPQYGLSVLRKNTKSKYVEWRILVGCIQSLQFDSGLWSQSWCSRSYWAQVGLPTNIKSIIWIGVFHNLQVTFFVGKNNFFFACCFFFTVHMSSMYRPIKEVPSFCLFFCQSVIDDVLYKPIKLSIDTLCIIPLNCHCACYLSYLFVFFHQKFNLWNHVVWVVDIETSLDYNNNMCRWWDGAGGWPLWL